MKRILPFALLLAVALLSPLVTQHALGAATGPVSPIGEVATAQGSPVYLGSYNATTSAKTNAEVATPFGTGDGLMRNKVLLVHNAGLVPVRLLGVSTSTGDVTTVRNAAGFGVYLDAGEKGTLVVRTDYLAVITTSSTSDVDVWELQ